MGVVARKAKAAKRGARGPEAKKRVPTCKGLCGYGDNCKISKPRRPQLRCCACNGARP